MRAALLVSTTLAYALLSGGPGHCQAQLDVTAPDGRGASNLTPAAARAADNAIPLSAPMIEELARRYNAGKTAEEQAVTQIAAPINRPVNVSFTPGASTPIINTVKGYPTAVSFFDSTGQPWPIQWDTNSNPAAVAGGTNCNVANGNGGPSVAAVGFFVCTPTKGSNVLEITPVSLAPRGGLVVSLEGAPKPIAFYLMTGGGRYDADLSVHVADRGPHAKVEIMTQPYAPDTGAPFLTSMLQGVPPADAVPLSVEGVSPEGLRAWRMGRNTYLRTRYVLLSPEWTSSEAEAGVTVYAVPNTPVVLLSVNDRTVSVQLKE